MPEETATTPAPDYHYPPMDQRKVIGTRVARLDGIAKSTGAAKYNSDVQPKDLLFAILVTSPYAHARVKSVDTSAAEKLRGVTAVRTILDAGKEVQWEGQEVAIVAANTEEIARDAARLIQVDYEVLPHLVREDDLSKAGANAKPAGEQVTGDPDQAFKDADVVSEGTYAIPVITHCCLEPHGLSVAWNGDHVDYWPSTQGVSDAAGDLARALTVPASNIHVDMQYIGGGFGSKFQAEAFGVECAQLSKASGGRPVRLFLDRNLELLNMGNRPSGFGKIRVGAKKDGTITVFFNAPRTLFAEKKDEIADWQIIHSQNDKVIDSSVFDFFGDRLRSGVVRDYDGQGYRETIERLGLPFRNFVNQPHWRILSQMHSVQLALTDFKQYVERASVKYDVVILTRTDLKWYEGFKYDHLNFDKINHTLYHMMSGDAGCYKDQTPEIRNAYQHRKRTGYASVHGTDKTFNDHVLVGTQDRILTYSNIYDMTLPYVQSGVIFNPETLYATHLMRNGIEWQPSDIGTFELWRWEQERWP